MGATERVVAETLERQVTSKLRESGLVVWLDKDGLYTQFVDELAERRQQGNFYAPVLGYRGSYLELLLALEKCAEGLDPEPLLLHLPGHTDVTVRATPLLEAYKAGTRFERALPTLVRDAATGLVAAAELERFLGTGSPTLAQAEEWLQNHMKVERTGLAAVLHHRKPEGVLEDLLGDRLPVPPEDRPALEAYLESQTGLDAAIVGWFHPPGVEKTARTLLEACVGWLLCVEYVGDLSRPPVLPELQRIGKLSAPLVKNCQALLKLLRTRYAKRYCAMANQTEALLEGELEAGAPEELGRIDTFSREDTRLLEASVEALRTGDWSKALDWSQTRLASPSVWLETDPLRRQEWQLVEVFAALGQALAGAQPLRGANSLAETLECYTSSIFRVDQAHRHFEQERSRLLEPRLRHFEALCLAAANLRQLYHRWSDELGDDFAEVCRAHGFLPEAGLQQRNLYEQVVHPLTQRGKGPVAYFMVDALRYEMAEELARRLARPAAGLQLKARLAELPTITRVGMNVLAPVAQAGRLKVAGQFHAFRSGAEYLVNTREQRLRAMGDRSLETLPGGRRSPVGLSLRDVSYLQPEELKKKVSKSPLIVVHSRDIDNAGEADLGIALFEPLLGELYSAVNLLRNAGVDDFVITADHGFLVLEEGREPLVFSGGTKVERRWTLTEVPARQDSTVSVSLSSLGCEGCDGHLQFPRAGSVFKTKGDLAGSFAHGGNSLQERVIPVLTLSYRGRDVGGTYELEARAKPPILGLPRLELRLRADAQMLLGYESKVIPLALRVVDSPGAQVICKQVTGAQLQHQQLLVPVGPDWVEVVFALEGGTAARASLEIYHPTGDEKIAPHRLPEFFDVLMITADAPEAPESCWEEAIEDLSHRRVFWHLFTYGSINEDELTDVLGTPSAARRFARNYEAYLPRLPFEIAIDSSGPLKRYLRK